MKDQLTAHISQRSTDGIGVSRRGESDELSSARERDDANIRWLLAAVLHHEADDEPRSAGEEE